MKKLFNLTALLILITGCIFLSGCSKTDYTVGVCQLVTHEALDEATRGFKEALEEKMEEAGKTIKIDIQNASGDSATCTSICSNFVSKKYDLIMANATPALQAAQNATTTIPILGTSITTYGEALGIELKSNDTTGTNISGTSDLADLDLQAQMILDFMPSVKKVGVLYCTSEANSLYQFNKIKAYLENKGVTVTKYTFTDSNDVSSVTTSAASKEEAIYIPTDNTAASNKEIIASICTDIPVFVGDSNLCDICGCASISISYYGIGRNAGLMAAEILLNGKDVSTLPIGYDLNPKKVYNEELITKLGLVVPAGFEKINK